MPKGYWIVRLDVTDADAYPHYVAANAEPVARFGGRYVVRGGRYEAVEGKPRGRNVVVEFPSFDAARDCYYDAAYQGASDIRRRASQGEFLIIEGHGD
jgi:uncharacterized protein (DUF1330 family)